MAIISKSSIYIPADIIHAIINELQDDTRALQTTSLVARSFLHPSQQNLFSRISINLHISGNVKAEAQRLLSTINARPELALHVRKLCLTIADDQTPEATVGGEKEEVISTLEMFKHLQTLEINRLPDWIRLDAPLRRIVLNLCALASVSEIALADTLGFPTDHILPHLPRLKRLSLNNCEHTRREVEEMVFQRSEINSPEALVEGQLEVLGFDCITARNGIVGLFDGLTNPRSRLRITHLRALKISGHGPYIEENITIEKIIGLIEKTLECFVWGTLDEASALHLYSSWVSYQPRFDKGVIDLTAMTNLRCLALSFVLNVASGNHTANSAWIVGSLKRMRANNRLEELVLILYPNQITDTAPDMEEWTSQLDLLLIQDGFESIAKVAIYLATPRPFQFPIGTEEYIAQQMPTLQTSGVLTVGRLHSWDDAQSIYNDAISRTLRAGRSVGPLDQLNSESMNRC